MTRVQSIGGNTTIIEQDHMPPPNQSDAQRKREKVQAFDFLYNYDNSEMADKAGNNRKAL